MGDRSKILLIDVDSKIPNIALMKIAAFYKSDYKIDIIKCYVSYYKSKQKKRTIDCSAYSKVFVSAIFPSSVEFIIVVGCKDITYGGSGYSLKTKLPDNIAKLKSCYLIYPDTDTSYGFLTRGCFRNCYFCIVPEKEGSCRKGEPLEMIVQHKKVKFLDNNFLGYKFAKQLLLEIISSEIKCQFNQGLDIRILNNDTAYLISKINHLGEYYFAFDKISDEQLITEKLNLFKKYIHTDWACKFFLYCHPDMDIVNDIHHRLDWCKSNKVLPYLMRDKTCFSSSNTNLYTDIAAWANQPGLFKNMSLKEFLAKRHSSNEVRNIKSAELFKLGKLNQDTLAMLTEINGKALVQSGIDSFNTYNEAEQLSSNDILI